VKKFIAIILLVCYSFSTLGLSVNFFYCCGILKSVSLKEQNKSCPAPVAKPQKSSCCKSKEKASFPVSGETFKKNCCQNKLLSFNLDIDQQDQKTISVNPVNKIFALLPSIFLPLEATSFTASLIASTYTSPPKPFAQGKNIFICVFRI